MEARLRWGSSGMRGEGKTLGLRVGIETSPTWIGSGVKAWSRSRQLPPIASVVAKARPQHQARWKSGSMFALFAGG